MRGQFAATGQRSRRRGLATAKSLDTGRAFWDSSDLESCLALLKASIGVESQGRRILRACHKHHLVTVLLPCLRNRMIQHLPGKTSSAESSLGDNILDKRIGRTVASEIRNYHKCAGAGQFSPQMSHKHRAAGISREFFQDLSRFCWRQILCTRMKLRVKLHEIG